MHRPLATQSSDLPHVQNKHTEGLRGRKYSLFGVLCSVLKMGCVIEIKIVKVVKLDNQVRKF